MISEEYDVSKYTDVDYNKGLLKRINGLFITENEIAVLEKYSINVNNIKDFKEMLAIIRNLLDQIDEEDEETFDELNYLYDTFSERDYYFNTHK